MTKAKKVPVTVTSLNQSQGLGPVILSSHRIKLFPERKHRKVVVHPQAAKAEHRRPGCPLLGATKKTCNFSPAATIPPYNSSREVSVYTKYFPRPNALKWRYPENFLFESPKLNKFRQQHGQTTMDTANVPIACRLTKINLVRVSRGSYRPGTQFAPGVPLQNHVTTRLRDPLQIYQYEYHIQISRLCKNFSKTHVFQRTILYP